MAQLGRVKKQKAVDGKAITSSVPHWLKAKRGEHITVIPERAATIKKIFQLAALGMGGTRIIRQLVADGHKPFGNSGKWTLGYIQMILCNRAVLGEYQPLKHENGKKLCEGDSIPNYYPPVIDYSEWAAARTVIDAKNLGSNHGGGRHRLDRVDNLFTGLIKDRTAGGRTMNFNSKGKDTRPAYLVTCFGGKNDKLIRIRYERFEKAFLHFLTDLDWKSVAGESESSEVKNLELQLSQISGAIEQTSKLIDKRTTQMENPDLDDQTVNVFASQIAKAQVKVADLGLQRDELSKTIESSRRTSEAMYSPQELLGLIKKGDTSVRLRLKAEIRKRVKRIDFHFGLDGWDLVVGITFINGAERGLIFKDGEALKFRIEGSL